MSVCVFNIDVNFRGHKTHVMQAAKGKTAFQAFWSRQEAIAAKFKAGHDGADIAPGVCLEFLEAIGEDATSLEGKSAAEAYEACAAFTNGAKVC